MLRHNRETQVFLQNNCKVCEWDGYGFIFYYDTDC